MEIPALINRLEKKYAEVFEWMDTYPEADLNLEKVAGKWTAAQHLDHLIKSTEPLNKALRLPRLALNGMFGKNNRQERTYDALVEKYQKALKTLDLDPKVASQFSNASKVDFTKGELQSTLEKELARMKKVLAKWKEKDMSVYLLPHPAIGKLTIREMIYFTIYHTEHHLKQLREKY